MAGDGFRLDQVAVFRQFPGLRILSAIRLAFDFKKVMIAAAGLVLLEAGWSVFDWLLPQSADVTPEVFWTTESARFRPPGLAWPNYPSALLNAQLLEPVWVLITPLSALVNPASDWARMFHGLLGLLWLVLVWGICGGAIARIALLQIAKQQQMAITAAFRFAVRFAASFCLAPFCPLLGILFCALLAAPFGALYRVPVVGPSLGGVLLFIPLVLGLVMTLLAAGMIAGWPLFHASVAAGADDALDALSRTLSYVSQRLGALCVLLIPIALQAIVGMALVNLIAVGVIQLTAWSLSLTAPSDLVVPLFLEGRPAGGAVAWQAHAFWIGFVRLLARGWIYSFTWSAAALLYLWLRNDVDSLPWTEVDLPGAPPPGPISQAPARAAGEPAPSRPAANS